jgi:hypothetical protein
LKRGWTTDEITDLSGTQFRVVWGRKGSGVDKRLDRWTGERWVPVRMEEVFFMTEFFFDNEEALQAAGLRPWWQKSAGTYFLTEVVAATKVGWEVPAAKIRNQRQSRGEAA